MTLHPKYGKTWLRLPEKAKKWLRQWDWVSHTGNHFAAGEQAGKDHHTATATTQK
ncbi:hypothetical protein [Rufibacter hautae]|uniref:hypothetical protein n=1 Tax=Rufibacter hautae TaxID=2595005 RepID=UPI00168110A5|nr:hypothetical protein [Rufibacter hautae]